MTSPLTIQVGKIKATGSLHVEERVPCAEFQESLGEAGTLAGPLDIALDLTVKGQYVTIKGQVRGEWELECGRCLARPRSKYDARVEASLEASGSAIDAAEEVRQAIALALPSRTTCKTDCKGLCPSCRADRNAGDCGCKSGSV